MSVNFTLLCKFIRTNLILKLTQNPFWYKNLHLPDFFCSRQFVSKLHIITVFACRKCTFMNMVHPFYVLDIYYKWIRKRKLDIFIHSISIVGLLVGKKSPTRSDPDPINPPTRTWILISNMINTWVHI